MTAGENIHIADSAERPVAAVNNIGSGEHNVTLYATTEDGEIDEAVVFTFTDDELAHFIFGLADYGAMNGLHIDPPV